MAKRSRAIPQSQSSINLSGDSLSSSIPSSPSSNFLSFPRSASPSSITGFLTKPSRWFSRPSPKLSVSSGSPEPPRSRNSSASRRPTISGPTDPRPILPATNSEGLVGASRSVLDLSLSRTQTNVEVDKDASTREGLGELRSMSRKGWSRSVDDLGKFPSTQAPSINTTNIKLSMSSPKEDGTQSPTKAMIEAYRQNTPHSPNTLHPYHPFPIIQPPSPGPPSPTIIPPNRSIPDVSTQSNHGWSYPHAPFQPSKLASPSSLASEQTSSPLPNPPYQRIRTASSFDREREKPRRGFPFPMNASTTSGKPHALHSNAAGSVPPEAQSPSKETDSKRTSQIVHHSGFINLHRDSQPTPRAGYGLSAALAKGWKPYKGVLKGSKLLFYKPLSDRTVPVKELFPQGMEPVVDERPETVQEEPEPTERPTGKDREEIRKRTRLYRGRVTHPEISVRNDRSIVKASSSALIHEAVFNTLFTQDDPAIAELQWKRFASAIILCLPRLMGRVRFEDEFIRYASYLISGADETDRSRLQSRSLWLAEKYVHHQGGAVGEANWAAFQAEYFTSIPSGSKLSSLDLDDPSKSRIPQPFIAVSPSRASLSRPSLTQPRSPHEGFWAALERDGLTSDVILKLDSTLIARSLGTFHRGLLAQNQQSLVGGDLITYDDDDDDENQHASFDSSPFAAFFGSVDRPQWLTRFIVGQVLSASGTSDDSTAESAQTSKTQLRAELISKWVRIGEHCRANGDICSWKSIEAALCSRPIARLDRAWRRVEGGALRSFYSWVNAADSVPELSSTPWGGDLRERVADLLLKARAESSGRDEQWDVMPMLQVLDCVEPVVEVFAPFGKNFGFDEQDEDVSRFARIWKSLSEQPAPRSTSLNQYLAQSLAAEPRQKCRFEPYHWQRLLNVSTIQTLIPLLFVEPLPTVTLINRDLIYRGKKDSIETGTHPGLDAAQVARMALIKPSADVRRGNEIRPFDSLIPIANGEVNGPILRLYDGELLLVMPKSMQETSSRPPSSIETGLERRPSQIRVGNPGLERKTSVARRSSLPSISQRSSLILSEPTSETSLRVIVKAGTLDRLVEVLICGVEGISVAVTDDNGEMPLREGRTRMLKLDRAEFRSTWWSTFRSFVSPLVLFELLRKRFLLSDVNSSASPVVLRIRLEIFSTIAQWLENGGALDALGDGVLYDSMKSFLATIAVTHIPESTSEEDRPPWIELENARQNTLAMFNSQTCRPKHTSAPTRGPVSSSRNYGRYPPPIDDIDPEVLVSNLDSLAAAVWRSVTQEDLFVTADLLEVQSVDRTGWFVSHEPSNSYEEVEIQTIYSHLQQIPPSHLISEMSEESFYKLLPPAIRSLVRAHAVVRKWAIACIVTPHLGVKMRQTRVEKFLQAIEVCRLRMTEAPGDAAMYLQRSIRSFVETALISALISPESRVFSYVWLSVAAARGTSADSLATLLSAPVTSSIVDKRSLTPDIGWLLERILEVISVPNIIDADNNAVSLINFEKRRHLYDLIVGTLSMVPVRSRKEQIELDRMDIDRLNHMHRDVSGPPFELRLLKEEAYRESISLPPVSLPKKNQRPFLKITQVQQEKYKRDKFLRERLLREKKAEQLRTEKREDDLNKAMQARNSAQIIKHQRSRRTMSSAFFQLMRPLSSAFSSDNIYAATQRRTAVELDFEPTGKPALVISLAGASVTAFINNVRLYTFNLTTEDGGRYLLQASSQADLASWLAALNKTAKSSTAKRLTYVGSAPKPQLSDVIRTPSQRPTRHPTKVFGVELEFLLRREAAGEEVPAGAVPRVLDRCLSEIEARGLQEVGLYRVPGSSSAIHALKEEFDNGGEITFFTQDYVDIWAVCDVVKAFFRELPHPLFPEQSYLEVLQVMKIADFEDRLMAVRDLVHKLPIHNFYILRRICEHLERVTDYEEHNHMTAQALSVIFNPSLLKSPLDDFGLVIQNMTFTSQLLQTLIVHFHRVFDETEAEMDQDDDPETNDGDTAAYPGRADSRLSSVPTDAIHDHDPDLEPLPSADPESLDAVAL